MTNCITTFETGVSVKLTDRFARALCKTPLSKVDWSTRRGVVVRCNAHTVAVAWSGRSSLDVLPIGAVESIGHVAVSHHDGGAV